MKLQPRLLLVFALTLLVAVTVIYATSRSFFMSSFLQLEQEQMIHEVRNAETALEGQNRNLSSTADDYAYWDRMYEFMSHTANGDIADEFQDGQMEGLNLDLIVLLDNNQNTVFQKAYDQSLHRAISPPADFLHELFRQPSLAPSEINTKPLDGFLRFPDSIYLISARSIHTSQRNGASRGTLLMAQRFGESAVRRVEQATGSSLTFGVAGSPELPSDFVSALNALNSGAEGPIVVLPIDNGRVGGYTLLYGIDHRPVFLMRADRDRPIYSRGLMSLRYVFAAASGGILLSLLVIYFFLQKFILSRLILLGNEITSIGSRHSLKEWVAVDGHDELASLAGSINGMLRQLRRSQSEFLFLAENIHQVFWIRDGKTGSYTYVSPAFEKMFGIKPEVLFQTAEHWKRYVVPEDLDAVEKMLAQQRSGDASETYYRVISENGVLHWLWERSFPSFDESGKLDRVIGITEDITDFKIHEEALLSAQEDLEKRVQQRTSELAERSELINLLVESTPAALYGMDAEGQCTFCNPAALRLLGYQDDGEILGHRVHALFHHTRPDGSPYPQSECPMFVGFRDGVDASRDDEVFWRKDGTSFPVEYRSRRIHREGKVIGAVVSFVDISTRKRQELELRHSQKLEAVGRLAAGIAHEINTPIQFIGDNTRFLQVSFQDELKLIRKYEELRKLVAGESRCASLCAEIAGTRTEIDWVYLEDEVPKAMDQMLEGLSRVSTIVRGMKEFSHVDRSNEKAPADLNRALESTLIVARNELKYVADVETDFQGLPPVVCHLGDLNQVFLNLLVNASHAIEEVVRDTGNKGRIIVRTRLEGDAVEISISDTGTGIPEDARDRIFDPFFTTKEVGKGTGQGLALARAIIVEKHGGTLRFETEMGKGTTFIIRLPLLGSTLREEALIS